jgi:hypothetical protein
LIAIPDCHARAGGCRHSDRLGETLTAHHVMGFVLITVGVWLASRNETEVQ